nr:MAG TPA: hypothetical protein [Caudoviricetes sp.]
MCITLCHTCVLPHRKTVALELNKTEQTPENTDVSGV